MAELPIRPAWRSRRGGMFLLAIALLGLVHAGTALGAAGDLRQKSGSDGCLSETGASPCADGRALDDIFAVTASPDGRSLYAASPNGDSVAALDRDIATGRLTQKIGTLGCNSETGDGGSCQNGVALFGASSVAVSADGKSAYVAARVSNAISIFDRDVPTGGLIQKLGLAACVSETGAGPCVAGRALAGAHAAAVSPDGKSVYVASRNSNAVAIFDRNTTSGALVQKPTLAGCVSETGAGPCAAGRALLGAISVTVSSDGRNVYVASTGGDAVAVFDRDTMSGALTQKPALAGCISESGAGPCTDGVALGNPTSLGVSADGRSVYVASAGSNAVAIFDRNTTSGALTQKPGLAGCISETGAGPCTDGVALGVPGSVVVAADGRTVYVAAETSDAVAIFDRNTTSGALTQKPGLAGCISETGAGPCTDGVGLDGAISVAVSPDGKNAYAGSIDGDAVTVFDRNDGIGPTTTITSGPSGLIKTATASFAFSSNEPGSTFQCKLDKGAYGSCTSPRTSSGLSDGPHSFSVRATDTEANTGAAASRGFTVDTSVNGSASARKNQQQKGRKIIVKAKVGAEEALSAKVSGKVRLGKKSYKLKNAAKDLNSGQSKNLKLKPKKRTHRKKIAKALKMGKKPKAKLTVKLIDGVGNSKSKRLSVRLTR